MLSRSLLKMPLRNYGAATRQFFQLPTEPLILMRQDDSRIRETQNGSSYTATFPLEQKFGSSELYVDIVANGDGSGNRPVAYFSFPSSPNRRLMEAWRSETDRPSRKQGAHILKTFVNSPQQVMLHVENAGEVYLNNVFQWKVAPCHVDRLVDIEFYKLGYRNMMRVLTNNLSDEPYDASFLEGCKLGIELSTGIALDHGLDLDADRSMKQESYGLGQKEAVNQFTQWLKQRSEFQAAPLAMLLRQ